ncbi:hypothetical protein [Halorussus sp. MSC15.2]|uniref:hypothetical protein n=1 Tax=Halorussus sp. MSC15.2 TaxID=2283638 RepID=UPI0013CFFAFF|nr:hypothetical protein [Halorussus sp. MSC15.2]NEU58785.1 hypothetical protein [Halorussus sp. MSC15.2]
MFLYLVVQTWQGSGNASVDLAPWRYELNHERETVVEPSEECGIDVALSIAHEYVHEHVEVESDADGPTVGQRSITDWGETA